MTLAIATRSNACRKTKAGKCGRLSGHKGTCRPTLTRGGATIADAKALPVVVAGPVVVLDDTVTVEGRTWHIVCLSDGTVTSTEVVATPEPVVAVEHKQAGKARNARQRKAKVRTLKPVGPEGRDVQTVGRAKRAKAVPAGTHSHSNAGALKGRIPAKVAEVLPLPL